MAPSVQGHGLPLPQEFWPYQSFSQHLVAGNQEASFTTLSIAPLFFRHLEDSLAWGTSLLF